MKKIEKEEKLQTKQYLTKLIFLGNEICYTFLWYFLHIPGYILLKKCPVLYTYYRSLKILLLRMFFLLFWPLSNQEYKIPFHLFHHSLNIVTHLKMQDKFCWRYEIWVKFQPITTMHQVMVTRELFISVGSGSMFCIKSYVFSWSYKEACNLHICIILSHNLYWFVWTNKLDRLMFKGNRTLCIKKLDNSIQNLNDYFKLQIVCPQAFITLRSFMTLTTPDFSSM